MQRSPGARVDVIGDPPSALRGRHGCAEVGRGGERCRHSKGALRQPFCFVRAVGIAKENHLRGEARIRGGGAGDGVGYRDWASMWRAGAMGGVLGYGT